MSPRPVSALTLKKAARNEPSGPQRAGALELHGGSGAPSVASPSHTGSNEGANGTLTVPGSPRGLLNIAGSCKGHACVIRWYIGPEPGCRRRQGEVCLIALTARQGRARGGVLPRPCQDRESRGRHALALVGSDPRSLSRPAWIELHDATPMFWSRGGPPDQWSPRPYAKDRLGPTHPNAGVWRARRASAPGHASFGHRRLSIPRAPRPRRDCAARPATPFCRP